MSSDSPASVTANIEMTVGGRPVSLQIDVPTAAVAPSKILPLVRSLAHVVVDTSVEAHPAPVSCAKGCGACCRQLVPLPLIEVRAIKDLVDAMPSPRRETIIARFEAACETMDRLGYLARIREFDQLSREEQNKLAVEYMHEGVACPFLEEESCSIHPDRPTICREYLVTSDPRHCSSPTLESIQTIPIPTKLSRALPALEGSRGEGYPRWIPLIEALAIAPSLPAERPIPGPQLLQALFTAMSTSDVEMPPLPSGTGG